MYIDSELLKNPELTITKKVVLAFILSETATKDKCLLTNSEICQRLCICTKTISNTLTKLSSLKYIRVSYNNNNERIIQRYKK